MQNYNAESIESLDYFDHVRKYPGMYIGSKDLNGLHHCVKEIISNSIDEFLNGAGSRIIVKVQKDGGIYIEDNGRGIPHGKHPSGCSLLQACFGIQNTGGKFNNDAYSVSSGLNGLGLTITNALSNFIEITSYRKGKYVKGYCEASNDVKLEYGDTTEKTRVIFQPNKRFFHTDKIPVDFVLEKCKIATALGYTSRLFIDGKEKRISSSMFDLIKEEDTGIHTYVNVPPMEVLSSTKEKMKVALRYTSDTKDRYFESYGKYLYIGSDGTPKITDDITSTQ